MGDLAHLNLNTYEHQTCWQPAKHDLYKGVQKCVLFTMFVQRKACT